MKNTFLQQNHILLGHDLLIPKILSSKQIKFLHIELAMPTVHYLFHVI